MSKRHSECNNTRFQDKDDRNMYSKSVNLISEDDYEQDDIEETETEHIMHKPVQEHCAYILAHSYVPQQIYHRVFSPEEALMKGTIFPELWGVYPIPD